jgi:hypothetical protein
MALADEPGAVSAMRLESVTPTDDGGFERLLTPLSRAGRWYERNFEVFERARHPTISLAQAQQTAELIHARDRLEPMPRRLEAEMADVYAGIGRALAKSTDAEIRAAALVWLERATKAAPAHPEQHYWPGRNPTAGFPQETAVRAAGVLLQRLTGG